MADRGFLRGLESVSLCVLRAQHTEQRVRNGFTAVPAVKPFLTRCGLCLDEAPVSRPPSFRRAAVKGTGQEVMRANHIIRPEIIKQAIDYGLRVARSVACFLLV